MRNGNPFLAGALCLALLVVSVGGCGLDTAPREQTDVARDARHRALPDARYQVDPQRKRVWILTSEALFVFDASRPERVAVPLPDWLPARTQSECMPDLALGPVGEAVIASNRRPMLWRIDPGTLAVSVHRLAVDAGGAADAGFSGLAYSPQQGAFVAASYADGGLWRIDARLERARRIPLSAPIPEPCGVTAAPTHARQAPGGRVNLCVHTPHRSWSVVFAPGWRSAYVSAAPCTNGPWPLDAAWPDRQ